MLCSNIITSVYISNGFYGIRKWFVIIFNRFFYDRKIRIINRIVRWHIEERHLLTFQIKICVGVSHICETFIQGTGISVYTCFTFIPRFKYSVCSSNFNSIYFFCHKTYSFRNYFVVVSKSFLDVVLETDLSLTLEVVSELFLEVVSKLFLL